MSAATAIAVLLLNLVFTIVAVAKFGHIGGIGIVYQGSCAVVNSLTIWMHVLVNALSALLLSASNYTMQALSAATRTEIDRAHAKGDWLDIGVCVESLSALLVM